MNREPTVTLTKCSVFILTSRTLDKPPHQRQLNWAICCQVCVEMIEDERCKK